METNDQHIENQLKKFNVTDAAIAELSEKYIPLVINGIEDKEGYRAVKTARLIMRDYRVGVDKLRKELVADALEYQRRINAEAKRITSLLEPIESHLTTQETNVDKEIERIRKEKQDKEDAEKRAAEEAIRKEQLEKEEEARRLQQEEFDRIRKEQEEERIRLEALRKEVQHVIEKSNIVEISNDCIVVKDLSEVDIIIHENRSDKVKDIDSLGILLVSFKFKINEYFSRWKAFKDESVIEIKDNLFSEINDLVQDYLVKIETISDEIHSKDKNNG